jgi:hypothetical protein
MVAMTSPNAVPACRLAPLARPVHVPPARLPSACGHGLTENRWRLNRRPVVGQRSWVAAALRVAGCVAVGTPSQTPESSLSCAAARSQAGSGAHRDTATNATGRRREGPSTPDRVKGWGQRQARAHPGHGPYGRTTGLPRARCGAEPFNTRLRARASPPRTNEGRAREPGPPSSAPHPRRRRVRADTDKGRRSRKRSRDTDRN